MSSLVRELVARLSKQANALSCGDWTAMDLEDNEVSHRIAILHREAADVLRERDAAVAELCAAVRPFAKSLDFICNDTKNYLELAFSVGFELSIDDLHRASAAFAKWEKAT